MKILSVSVAAYNVEEYLRQTLESFLISEELQSKIEVIIVSDGSTDRTVEIAKEFESRYPGVFLVVDKENGGYGSTINSSLNVASGKYFKTVDGDDWVDKEGLEQLIKYLEQNDADLAITKFTTVSDVDGSTQMVTNGLHYDNRLMQFDELLCTEKPGFLSMHALTFRTDILKHHNIVITEKCFYTDVELVMKPIPYIETAIKIDANVYMYRVGREGQSVSLKSRMKHMDQAIFVNHEKCAFIQSILQDKAVSETKKQYLCDAVIQDISIQYYFLLAYGEKKRILEAECDFDKGVKERCPYLYEGVLNTKYGDIIAYLRKTNFQKIGVRACIHHLKLEYVDLRR